MQDHDFTLAEYARLVRAFLDRGYAVVGFESADAAMPHLVLRHDVDMCLERALRLAETEAALGVRSIYYVLLRTEMYSLFAERSVEILHGLARLGHEVGLHFDASLHPQDRQVLERAAAAECAVLEGLLGAPVRSISFHRPAAVLQGMEGLFAGRPHSYEPRFFSAMGYCSDSQGRWRFGHPLDHPAVAQSRALQLVTHPVWWDAGPGETVVGKLERLLAEKSARLAAEVGRNCIPFQAHLDGGRPPIPMG